MSTVGEPNGTLRYRVESLEKEQERQRARTHDLVADVGSARLLAQRSEDKIENLSEDLKAVQRTLVSVQRALWGFVITGMTVAVTVLSGVHFR